MSSASAARRRRRRLWWALAPVVLLAALASGVWFGQRSLVYFPDASAPGSASDHFARGADVQLSTGDDLLLSAWRVDPAEPRGAAVLYLPGNAGNRLHRAGLAQALADRGFTVLLLDYRGFGGNPGSPSEAGLLRDAEAGARHLRDAGFDADRLFIVGESIGTGVATTLATTTDHAGLVLRSPYESLAALAQHHYGLPLGLLLRDRFDTVSAIGSVSAPVLVLAAGADDVIPLGQSEAVAEAAGHPHEFVVIPDAGHNDPVWFGEDLAERIARFAEETAEGRGG